LFASITAEGTVFGKAELGAVHVITRARDTSVNLRTHLTRIIKRAGLEPWPKLWHNQRSTRQTELAERYPIHIVCAWIGNTRDVAQDRYLQVTDTHFESAAQNPARQQSESDGNAPQTATAAN
jgi:hypothetical protein